MENTTKYNEGILNWPELEGIGINRDELVKEGRLQNLLNGETIGPVPVRVTVMGEIQEMEVDLQLREEENIVILQMTAVQPEDPFLEPDDEIL